jgi:hypothetical protein
MSGNGDEDEQKRHGEKSPPPETAEFILERVLASDIRPPDNLFYDW